jgi:hypothetical protein
MRKEDRIRQQQGHSPSDRHPEQPAPRPAEQMKGSESGDQPAKPPRQSGKLPLPE